MDNKNLIDMVKKIFLLCVVFMLALVGCTNKEPDIASIVQRANVVYDSIWFQKGYSHVPLYVANGIIGGCFDHMGFQSRPNTGTPEGRTVIGYINHYESIEKGRQIQFPLAYINAMFVDGSSVYNLVDAKNYKQELDIFSGVLKTQYNLFGKTEISAFASQQEANLFFVNINRQSDSPAKKLKLSIECETSSCQNNDTYTSKVGKMKVSFQLEKDKVRILSTTNAVVTNWILYCPGAGFEIDGTQLLVYLPDGVSDLRIWVKHNLEKDEEVLSESYQKHLNSHIKIWQNEWSKSWLDLPEDRAQKIWTRMKYYSICNFPLIVEKPMIPSGLNSNIWGFTFPQDVYFVADNLPRTGHFERAELAMQYWLEILPEVRKYTLRIMGVEGAFYPWTPPYNNWEAFEKDGVLGADSYELHNPTYVAAMVWHYYKYTGDTIFLKKYNPIIRGVFEFYKNISKKNEEGTYDIFHINARGQDEHSSTDGKLKNLLCAGYSAEYAARMLIETSAITGDTTWLWIAKDIQQSGMNRKNLLQANNIFNTYEGDNRPMGKQKHPVQLNPITYVPMPELCDTNSSVFSAWKNRYLLTGDARKPLTYGWTLGQFFWSSCRMGEPLEAQKDLNGIQPCHGADPMWIQFYESSFWERWHVSKSYYFPMHGLYQQAFTDALVQDWRGFTDIFACLLPDWENKKISFHGLVTLGGAAVSGEYFNGKYTITIFPGKSEAIDLRVSRNDKQIIAKGFKEGQKVFAGKKRMRFIFDGKRPIIISNK